MTRKHKFKTGDMVVLTKNILTEGFPFDYMGSGATLKAKQELRDLIMSRTGIRHVARATKTSSATLFAGTIGVVKGYENVFMLNYKLLSGDRLERYQKAHPGMEDTVSYVDGWQQRCAYVNDPHRRHLIVLIDGKLVAFENGGKLFEHAEAAQARYDEVTVSVRGTLTFRLINDAELSKKLSGRLSTLQNSLGSLSVDGIELKHRDGTVEKRELK